MVAIPFASNIDVVLTFAANAFSISDLLAVNPVFPISNFLLSPICLNLPSFSLIIAFEAVAKFGIYPIAAYGLNPNLL
jgi:hypothetical protein